MLIYLPIAELSVNMFIIFGMGAAVGFLSGLFGVGGGFLLTPLLIFSGIPPVVSVATVASQIVASSASAALSYWRRRMIDVKLATVLMLAGIMGSLIGVTVFNLLSGVGQLDLIVAVSYVTFLGLVGGLMLTESVRAILNARRGRPAPLARPGQHNWIHGLPFKMRFKRSRLYVSAIPVVALGVGIGFLGALLGIGGGFILVPALIYLLRVPTNVVIGTSLVQIVATMSVATVLHALTNHSVDIVLAIILMVGGVVGAQFGARIGQNIRGDQLRALLALLVLAVAVPFLAGLVTPPAERFSLTIIAGDVQVKRGLAIALLGLAGLAGEARAERLTIALSTPEVKINSNFSGTTITIFGIIERDAATVSRANGYEVAVVVRGPPETTVARRKESFLGVWANGDSETFVNVPSFYTVATTRNLTELSSSPVLQRMQIGFDNIDFTGGDRSVAEDPEVAEFRPAFLRLKQEAGLYAEQIGGVSFIGESVFRATIWIPANVPIGHHTVGVYLFSGEGLLAVSSDGIEITKTGFEQYMFEAAHRQAAAYGLGCIALALVTGWLAGVIFRRD